MDEIWKSIVDYPDYMVSNLGRVKSFKRDREKILKQSINDKGYLNLSLSKNKKSKNFKIHKLVAIAFLNHVPCGYAEVVNHINFNKTDNRLENLELTTARENSNQKHMSSSSIYTGVSRFKNKYTNKWRASITIGRKFNHIGLFNTELEASAAYEAELKKIKNKS